MRKPSIALFLVAAVFMPSSHPAHPQTLSPPPQFAVSPARFELVLGSRPVTESVRLFNLGKDPLEIRVSVASWDLDEANEVRHMEPGENTLDQWMVINPLRFTVPPGGYQTVRFSIRTRIRPAEGEYRAMIYFEQVLDETAESSYGMRVAFTFGTAVYAHVGEQIRSARLEETKVEIENNLLHAGFDISSLGNAHVRLAGQWSIWPADSYPGEKAVELLEGLEQEDFRLPSPLLGAGFLPTTPILPETRRTVLLTAAHRLPAGDYIFHFQAELAGRPLRRGIAFVVTNDSARSTPYPKAGPGREFSETR